MESRVLCLTGMHRSGTSLTAAWLQRCGLVIDLGGLVGAEAGNPGGHFEDLEIVNLHRKEFYRQARKSRGWQLRRSEFLTFSPRAGEQAVRLLRTRSAQHAQWGWKDPRSVVFLPQWRALEPDLAAVILWRPAMQVASSLVRRSRNASNREMRIGAGRALETWSAYNGLALRYRTMYPEQTLLIRLQTVLERSEYVLDRVCRQFGLHLRYTSIAELFNPRLLSGIDSVGIWRRRPWLSSRLSEATVLERELDELSDL